VNGNLNPYIIRGKEETGMIYPNGLQFCPGGRAAFIRDNQAVFLGLFLFFFTPIILEIGKTSLPYKKS
jgi:hypothetical protein